MHLMLVKESEHWHFLQLSEKNVSSDAMHSYLVYNKGYPRDLPGGPEVTTLCVRHRGCRFSPCSGMIPHAWWGSKKIFLKKYLIGQIVLIDPCVSVRVSVCHPSGL